MLKLYTSTRYEYVCEEGTFEVPFEFIDGPEHLIIKEDRAWLAVIAYDSYVENPFKSRDQGGVVEAPRYGFDADEMKRVVRANPGRVYWIRDNYPELVAVKDTKSKNFDVSDWEKYYICPEDASDTYAESVWKSYREWLNGECFGIAVWEYVKTPEGWEFQEDSRDSECWGFIGLEYVEEELKAMMPREAEE
jgi:hypothetical protein